LAASEESPTTPVTAGRRPPEPPPTLVLVLSGRIQRDDIPRLCECARALLEGEHGEVVVCDVGAVVSPDAVTVDALARLQLVARRVGRRVLLLHAERELLDLLDLMGLANVVPLCGDLSLEARRKTEQREEPRGVEKERDSGDPFG
jgi:ABC-type transporter Mla MlaB component